MEKEKTFKKFTFKTQKIKWQSDSAEIKLTGRQCGNIARVTETSEYQVRLMIVNTEEHAGWYWIGLTGRYKTLAEAKDFVILNNDAIQKRHTLYLLPKD